MGFIVSGLVPHKGQQLITELGDLDIPIPEALADALGCKRMGASIPYVLARSMEMCVSSMGSW